MHFARAVPTELQTISSTPKTNININVQGFTATPRCLVLTHTHVYVRDVCLQIHFSTVLYLSHRCYVLSFLPFTVRSFTTCAI